MTNPSDEGAQKMSKLFLVWAMGVCVAAGVASGAAAAAGKSTLDNLQAAFNGESNAKAKYEAFSLKADEEGYKSVAAPPTMRPS